MNVADDLNDPDDLNDFLAKEKNILKLTGTAMWHLHCTADNFVSQRNVDWRDQPRDNRAILLDAIDFVRRTLVVIEGLI